MRWINLLLMFFLVTNLFGIDHSLTRKRKVTPWVEAGSKTDKTKKKKVIKISKKSADYKKFEEILDFGISNKRIWMIQQIVEKKEKQYYPLLKRVLKNEKYDRVLIKVIKAVNELKLKQYVSLIAKQLSSDNIDLKVVVIKALGDFKSITYESKIQSILLSEKNKWVKKACIAALGKMKSQKGLSEMIKLFNMSETKGDTKIIILTSIGNIKNPSSVPFLKENLEKKSNTSLIRAYSAGALGKIGTDKAFSILKKHVYDEDTKVVMAVVEAFGELKSEKGYSIVFQLLKHDNAAIRFVALKSLQKLKNPKSFGILNYIVYNDDNFKVREKAVEVLSQLGGAKVVQIWEKELNNNLVGLKYQIIKNIHNLKKKDAIILLKKTFNNDKNIKMRKILLEKLFEIESSEAVKLIAKKIMNQDNSKYLELKLHSIATIYRKLGDKGISVLEQYLSHQNIHVRRYAYFYLIGMDKTNGRNAVFRVLTKEKDKNVILYVIKIFKDKKIKSSIPLLKNRLKDSFSPEVRKKAREAISYLESI